MKKRVLLHCCISSFPKLHLKLNNNNNMRLLKNILVLKELLFVFKQLSYFRATISFLFKGGMSVIILVIMLSSRFLFIYIGRYEYEFPRTWKHCIKYFFLEYNNNSIMYTNKQKFLQIFTLQCNFIRMIFIINFIYIFFYFYFK